MKELGSVAASDVDHGNRYVHPAVAFEIVMKSQRESGRDLDVPRVGWFCRPQNRDADPLDLRMGVEFTIDRLERASFCLTRFFSEGAGCEIDTPAQSSSTLAGFEGLGRRKMWERVSTHDDWNGQGEMPPGEMVDLLLIRRPDFPAHHPR